MLKRSPLVRRTALKRKTRMKQVSDKRRKLSVRYGILFAQMRARIEEVAFETLRGLQARIQFPAPL